MSETHILRDLDGDNLVFKYDDRRTCIIVTAPNDDDHPEEVAAFEPRGLLADLEYLMDWLDAEIRGRRRDEASEDR